MAACKTAESIEVTRIDDPSADDRFIRGCKQPLHTGIFIRMILKKQPEFPDIFFAAVLKDLPGNKSPAKGRHRAEDNENGQNERCSARIYRLIGRIRRYNSGMKFMFLTERRCRLTGQLRSSHCEIEIIKPVCRKRKAPA